MTYNEAQKLAFELSKAAGGNYIDVDENDNIVVIEGWLSFDQLRKVAAMLPQEERADETE